MCLMMSCVGSTLMYLYIERGVLSLVHSSSVGIISVLLFSWYSALAFAYMIYCVSLALGFM